jgi:hypothetical protein
MSVVGLLHPGHIFQVHVESLVSQCDLFSDDAAVRATPYAIRSAVPLALFQDFLKALNNQTIGITNKNVAGLSLLCTEFGFGAFTAKFSKFRASRAFLGVYRMENSDVESRISALQGHLTAALARISSLEARAIDRHGWPKISADSSALKSAALTPG